MSLSCLLSVTAGPAEYLVAETCKPHVQPFLAIDQDQEMYVCMHQAWKFVYVFKLNLASADIIAARKIPATHTDRRYNPSRDMAPTAV